MAADVVIHCGDLTQNSAPGHLRRTIDMLRSISAPLKLVIAGNHDRVLDDIGKFRQFEAAAREARQLFNDVRSEGILYLDEGNHTFDLANGARLRVYASSWTPAKWDGRAFQYRPENGHDFKIGNDVDVVITHGPPLRILDNTSSNGNAGDPDLFMAVARVRPLLHCFGHIHSGWGAILATWHARRSQSPFSYTDIDNDNTIAIEHLRALCRNRYDDAETSQAKAQKLIEYRAQGFAYSSHCSDDLSPLRPGEQTFFVNAAYEWSRTGNASGITEQLPWIVEIELPTAK
ncbi:uncharacterized protein PG998_007060 [Apiospora kogelbergensis]|uniref:uncharacterized protein n=1 Tax=Apiospora kogelbergensis TaxID=1337665 RepID=UPI00312F635E